MPIRFRLMLELVAQFSVEHGLSQLLFISSYHGLLPRGDILRTAITEGWVAGTLLAHLKMAKSFSAALTRSRILPDGQYVSMEERLAMGQPHFCTMRGWEHDQAAYVEECSSPSEHLFKAYHPKIGVPSSIGFWSLFKKHLQPIISQTFFGPETATGSRHTDLEPRRSHVTGIICFGRKKRNVLCPTFFHVHPSVKKNSRLVAIP